MYPFFWQLADDCFARSMKPWVAINRSADSLALKIYQFRGLQSNWIITIYIITYIHSFVCTKISLEYTPTPEYVCPATSILYKVFFSRLVNLIWNVDKPFIKYSNLLSESFLYRTTYCITMPLLKLSGIVFHFTVIDVKPTPTTLKSSGGALGTNEIKDIEKILVICIQACVSLQIKPACRLTKTEIVSESIHTYSIKGH